MTNIEYQSARMELGLSVSVWIKFLGISMDTHKGYSCGRKKIQAPVENHIKTMLKINQIQKSLMSVLP